jgi:hypothetical protein
MFSSSTEPNGGTVLEIDKKLIMAVGLFLVTQCCTVNYSAHCKLYNVLNENCSYQKPSN